MPPDCYKVEVLHLLNPHLIWVEVRDPAITANEEHGIRFEQIGIYGLLPLETTIDLEDEELHVQSCKDWQPASASLLRKYLTDEEDIIFSPVHLDRRSSIFDDNIHKFGDLIIKKKNGKTKSLSTLLKSSGFATYDACMFHQYLSEGKINTKLNNVETQEVLTQLEKYFINKNVPKKRWEKPISKQTSVVRASCELEVALTKTNLDKHNKHIKAILEEKNRALELCKGVDEPSVGRATAWKGKEKTRSMPVEKKLEILHTFKSKEETTDTNNEHAQAFEDTKMYLETMASPHSTKISSKTDSYKAKILKKVMSKTAIKKGSKQDRATRHVNESKESNETEEEYREPVKEANNSFSSSGSERSIISISDEQQIPKSEEIMNDVSEPSTSSQEQNNIVSVTSLPKYVENNESVELKPEADIKPQSQQQSVKAHVATPSSKENNKNIPNCHNYDEHRRHSKGKTSKKYSKAEVYIPTLESPEPKESPKESKPSQPRLAYPMQISTRDPVNQIARRVPDIPNEREAFASKPVSEFMVNKLMHTFKLTDSKHSEMIKNAIRKCKDGAKNNSEAIAALLECKSKIMDDIKVLDDPNNSVNLDKELPLGQTASKGKVKRRIKKHPVLSARAKTLFGPPGIDFNSLTGHSRVPPVYVYGEETTSDVQTTEINDEPEPIADKEPTINSEVQRTIVPSVSENKTVIENKKLKETVKKERNENKEMSSSSSSVWEKRLKLHKEMAKNRKKCASNSSDTTNKDSSCVDESPPKNFTKQIDVDSDESISEIIEKLAIDYSKNPPLVNKDDEKLLDTEHVDVRANPFQNFDINNSVFVDNLVTPVMMVHSKMNSRFVPICSYGDINFSSHIRLVLKNLRVDRPMMIQSISWNAILRGYSVFMVGSAGSGKTMGYLPAVCRILTDFNQSDSFSDSVGPFCIIVCATSQSVSAVEKIATMLVGCSERVVSCYHGHDELAIATSLLNGCDLLICTAPSLVRLLQMPEFGLDLQRLATFVLDDCERLSEVYSNELKFSLYKIKEMLKLRVNKELLVQYVVASRIWCDFMEPFAKKAPNAVVCIGAFQECVLYSKANMTVSYVKKENKVNLLIDFLKDIDPSKRTVVVCDTDEEVDYLSNAIQTPKYHIFASNSKMSIQDLYNLNKLWKEFKEPLMAPILICLDTNLYHMNVVNANYLIQYSMPSLYSTFCRRFATLNESYPSIFKSNNEKIKILILLEENNVEQFPKIINYVKRCTNNLPDFLDDICITVLVEKDAKKAESFAPLCNTLLSLGNCPDLYNCQSRHSILKAYDNPKEWMPKSGLVTFKILHYQSATFYSARLIAHFDGGQHTKYPTSYSSISLKMGTYYSKAKNRILLGVPKLGDFCAVALSNNLFSRAQVIKIVDRCPRGNPKNVLVNLIDEEIIEITSDINMYHLPDDLKDLNTYVVHIRLANIQPRDKDIVFSELAKDDVKKLTNDLKKGMYMKGKIVLTVANCIFVDTLETCQDLKSLNESVVMNNVKRELLEKHAEINPDHITKIEELCKKAGLELKPLENKVTVVPPTLKVMPKISWAHLEEDMSMVDFGEVENPDMLFARLTKFDDCMKTLITDIQKHVTDNPAKIDEFTKGDIVLAEYPDDGMYERARIDKIGDDKVKCFFVDQGEWRHLSKDKFKLIPDQFITQLPFQAIECRLVGIKPPGDQWTDFASNWLFDKCAGVEFGPVKQMFVKYFTKEPARFTGGYKYGVVVVDTNGNEDVILNQAMIDLNLAKEVEDEIKFLDLNLQREQVKHDDDGDDDDSWEKVSKNSVNSDISRRAASIDLLSQPIRSMPLIGTDEDSDELEKWNINLTADMAEMFRPLMENSVRDTKLNLPAIESNENEITGEIDIESLSKNIEECSRQFQRVKINPDSSKELDSDDLSSPETCPSANESLQTSEQLLCVEEAQLRKPKLNWRQTKTTVMIKIQLIGVEKYNIKILDRALSFTATANDTDYGFDIELYGVIDRKNATHSNKGQYIQVKFNKIMHKNWLTLTKDGGIRKWIVYDVDSIDTSSDDEEEVRKDNLYNIMKSIHNDDESDSDEDFVDDVSYRH